MTAKTCVITGVGDGTGASLARRFHSGGYKVAMLARRADRLQQLEQELPNSKAYPVDVSDQAALAATVSKIKEELGNPSVLIHNAVRATFGTFQENDPEELNRNFQVNTMSLLRLARELVPPMVEAGHGAVVVTGNTAALRGIPSYSLFAPTKAAQRILTQAMARELGPKGVHVSYVVIDAAIDTPWSKDKPVQGLAETPLNTKEHIHDGFFCQPSDIADEVYHVAHQAKSAWSFDVEIRPYGEKW